MYAYNNLSINVILTLCDAVYYYKRTYKDTTFFQSATNKRRKAIEKSVRKHSDHC